MLKRGHRTKLRIFGILGHSFGFVASRSSDGKWTCTEFGHPKEFNFLDVFVFPIQKLKDGTGVRMISFIIGGYSFKLIHAR